MTLFSSIASMGSVQTSSSRMVGGRSVSGGYGSNNVALSILATAKTTTAVDTSAATSAVLDAAAKVGSAVNANANVNSNTSITI